MDGVGTECRALSTVGFIPLTRGMTAIVDAADLPVLTQFRWHAMRSTGAVYAGACGGKRSLAMIGKRHFKMHAMLLGFPPMVDHANRYGLDNRRRNLRPCTLNQNSANASKSSGTTSRFKGVSWHKKSSRWQAYVSKNNKSVYVGCSKCETTAARMYDNAARELYGEFARLNFPTSPSPVPTKG